MKKKFGNLLMAATLVLAVGVFFSSCKDHDEELVAELQSEVIEQMNNQLGNDLADLKAETETALGETTEKIGAATEKIGALEARIAELESINHDDYATKEELAAAKQELAEAIDALAEQMATKELLQASVDSLAAVLRGEYATVVEQFDALSTTVTTVAASVETLKGQFAGLDARVAAIENAKYQEQIDAIKGDLEKVLEQAAAADARSLADSVRIDVLQAYTDSVAAATADSIAALRAEAVANLAAAKAYADEAAAAVAEELAATNATVAALEAAYKLAVAELQDQIDVLAEKVDEVVAAVEEFEERLGLVQSRLDNQITSIVLNGAYSPVTGYFSLPTGVKSNVLAAYYGEANDFYFPTTRTGNSVSGVNFTDADFALLGIEEVKQAGGVLVSGNGNAGKVYMTINPAEVSLEGKEFSLVNSLGEEAPAKITNVKKSEDKLAFGFTRDGAVAMYEAEATIAAEDIRDAKIRMELSDLADAIKDVVTISNGFDVADVVTTLSSLVNDVADAHAVAARWEDAAGTHTVYSDFGLATVAIKPLSYSFMADMNLSSIPGYHKGMNVVNKVFDKVGYINIPDLGLGTLSSTLESLDFAGAIGDSLKFTVTYSDTITKDIPFSTTVDVEVELPLKDINIILNVPVPADTIYTGAFDYNGDEIVVKVPARDVEVDYTILKEDIAPGTTSTTVDINETITVEIPVKFEVPVAIATKDVLGDLGGTLENMGTLVDQVNGMLASINGKVETVESLINVAKDKVQNGLNKYLDKLNNGLCKVINSFNGVLQPTMLISTTDGFTMLSSIKAAPTTIDKASAVLVPTSFTGEILAPACKKYVAVTKAYDANGKLDEAAAKAANTGDLNTVLEGGVRTVEFEGKAGYTYEITYSAADFYGMTSTTKYYVRVK